MQGHDINIENAILNNHSFPVYLSLLDISIARSKWVARHQQNPGDHRQAFLSRNFDIIQFAWLPCESSQVSALFKIGMTGRSSLHQHDRVTANGNRFSVVNRCHPYWLSPYSDAARSLDHGGSHH
jgi:hypothetical protein